MKNTRIELMYCDAGNFKTFIEVILRGAISDDQLLLVKSMLDDHCKIIAHQIGLQSPREVSRRDLDAEMDHVYTELTAFSNGLPVAESLWTHQPVTREQLTVDEFVRRIVAVEAWDIRAEMDRIGLSY